MEIGDFGDGAQALDFVVVDDGDEVVEAVLGGEEDGLPIGAFVEFAVAEQREDLPRFAIAAGGEGLAETEGKPVPQRPGAEFNPGDPMADMRHEAGAVLAVGFEFGFREKPPKGECGVEAGAIVALAENEAVPIGPVRLVGAMSKDSGIKDGEQIGHRERSGDVGGFGACHHAKGMGANTRGEDGAVDGGGHHRVTISRI